MAGQEPASAPQGGGFRLYARGFRQDATRSRPRLRAVTLGPVAIAVLLLLAWSSSGNGGGAVHRREAAGVAVETPRVESAESVKTTPAKVQDVATQPDDGGFVPFARRKRVSAVRARSNNKSNNDDAPITVASAATVAGVDGEDEEEARRSSREEPMVVKAEDVERAKAEAETRERAIAEAGERRKERSETKSPSIAKKVEEGNSEEGDGVQSKGGHRQRARPSVRGGDAAAAGARAETGADTGDEAGASYGGGTEGHQGG